jgi:hypothetical protein
MDLPEHSEIWSCTNPQAIYLAEPNLNPTSALTEQSVYSWTSSCQLRRREEEVYAEVLKEMTTNQFYSLGKVMQKPMITPEGAHQDEADIIRLGKTDITLCTFDQEMKLKIGQTLRALLGTMELKVEYRRPVALCFGAFTAEEDLEVMLEVLKAADEELLLYLLGKMPEAQVDVLIAAGRQLDSWTRLHVKLVKHKLFQGTCAKCTRTCLNCLETGLASTDGMKAALSAQEAFCVKCDSAKLAQYLTSLQWEPLSREQLDELWAFEAEVRLKNLYLAALANFSLGEAQARYFSTPRISPSILNNELSLRLYSLPNCPHLYPSEGASCFDVINARIKLLASELRQAKRESGAAFEACIKCHLAFLESFEEYSQTIHRRYNQFNFQEFKGRQPFKPRCSVNYNKFTRLSLTEHGLLKSETQLSADRGQWQGEMLSCDDDLNKKLYHYTDYLMELFCLDYRRDFVTVSVAPMHCPRSNFALAYCDGFVYAIGGRNDTKIFRECERYSVGKQSWEVLPSLVGSAAINYVVVLEGARRLYGLHCVTSRARRVHSIFELSLDSMTWKYFEFLNEPRTWAILKPNEDSTQLYMIAKRAVCTVKFQENEARLVKLVEVMSEEASSHAYYSQGHLITIAEGRTCYERLELDC